MRRDKPDYFSRRAKKEGYAARSVYKLQEIQNKYTILQPGMKVLDIGASPGSWSQLALKIIGGRGVLLAVDLNELNISLPESALERFKSIQGDVLEEETVKKISAYAPFNAIISDAAPSTSGNRSLDTSRSAAICEQLLFLESELLMSGGNFLAKIFQGGEEQSLLQEVRKRFAKGALYKPKSSRKESFESYLVGLEKK